MIKSVPDLVYTVQGGLVIFFKKAPTTQAADPVPQANVSSSTPFSYVLTNNFSPFHSAKLALTPPKFSHYLSYLIGVPSFTQSTWSILFTNLT